MSESKSAIAIVAKDLCKSYRLGRVTLEVLKGVTLEARGGEFVAIMGASGSGKSTLLHLLGLLDVPDAGSVFFDGVDAAGLSAGRRNRIRCRDVGFVFQFYHLLPELDVLENVMLPAKVDASTLGWFSRRRAVRKRAEDVLAMVGLQGRLRHRPKELSGGERQRVAIARALMNSPKVLLADEPTGNLDSKSGRQIIRLLHRCNEEYGLTVVMVTHDDSLAREANRYLVLKDGSLVA
ncbi:MAG TPA: ABC transporter ATP-binding protein [Phycisphaerae bacterium]|nr:ABC transporter ATP-binding protein [Phycisphaerae bacterium]